MLYAKELVSKDGDELESLLEDKQAELFHFINECQENKKVEKPHLFKQIKKEIARIKTVINAKKRAQ